MYKNVAYNCDNDPNIIRILIETVKQIARLMQQIIVIVWTWKIENLSPSDIKIMVDLIKNGIILRTT